VCRVRAAGKGFGGVGGYDGLSSCVQGLGAEQGQGPSEIAAGGSRPRCFLKPRADLAARRALHRGWSRDRAVVLDRSPPRGVGDGPDASSWRGRLSEDRGGTVGAALPGGVAPRWHRQSSRRGAEFPAGGAPPHPNGPFLGENGVHRQCPPGPARRITDGGGSPTVKVARELRVPTCARAGVGDGVPDLDGHSGVRREGVALATFYCRAGLESPTACAVLGEG
jgi:hypothetical protein